MNRNKNIDQNIFSWKKYQKKLKVFFFIGCFLKGEDWIIFSRKDNKIFEYLNKIKIIN